MTEDVNDLTIRYEEDGIVTVQEIDKEILSKGAWATILFRYREWDFKKDDYGPEKFTLQRFRKMRGVFRRQSKFNISSRDQATKIVDTLSKWLADAD